MTTMVVRGEGLPSIEKARALLTQCRTVKECMKIKALAQAVASVEASEGARNEAAAIVLLAQARVGDLTKELEAEPAAVTGARGGRGKKAVPGRNSLSRTERLKAEGLDRKEAAECEKLAALATSGDLDRLIKKAGGAVTKAVALAFEKLEPEKRKEVLARVDEGNTNIKKILSELKLEAKYKLAEKFRKNPIVTPDGRYQVIIADPPWEYDTADDTSKRGRNDYPSMTVEEICKLPVAKLAQKNCILWLWTTNQFMAEAFQCLDAWGFEQKTILTWDKVNIGNGNYLRNITEHCLLAIRGKPVLARARTSQTTLIREKRREHSRKPEVFYELVDKVCPGSKLEMFARESRKGWTAWGGEAEKFDAAE